MSAPTWYRDGLPCPHCDQIHGRCARDVRDPQSGDKRPCRANPVGLGWLCVRHRGMSASPARNVGQYAQDLVAEYGAIGDLIRACGIKVAGRDAIEALEDALHRANTMVLTLSILVETLAPRARYEQFVLGEGTPRERIEYHTITEGLIGPDHQGDAMAHPWVVLLGDWTDRQGRLAKAAADLGLTERQVRVQEAQVKLMADTITGILTDLGIDMADPRAMGVIERRLLALDSQTASIETTLTATATAS